MPIALIAVAILVVAATLIARRKKRKTFVVRSPRFGILNLKGPEVEPLIATDIEALTPILGAPIRGTALSPFCDVLFVYCDIGPDGNIVHSSGTLRDLIQKLRAPLGVVASENSGEAYIASTKGQKYGRANLVMTLSTSTLFEGELRVRNHGQ